MRNAVKRIAHKERAQPDARKKLGLLEKHKDYVERANDFKKKKKVLTSLRKKAEERNPDEFYHKMYNSQVKNGRHEIIDRRELTPEMLHVLQSQDIGYLVHKKTVDDRKIARLRETLHLIGDVAPKTHKIFVDSEDDVQNFDEEKLAQRLETLPSLLERNYNRPRESQLEAEKEAIATKKRSAPLVLSPQHNKEHEQEFLDKSKKRKLSPELAEIKARSNRSKKINEALHLLTQKRNALRPGHKVKVEVTKRQGSKEKKMVIYKFKRERAK